MRELFESVPMIMGIVAIFLAGHRGLVSTNQLTTRLCAIMIIASILLLSAQSSWAWSLFISGSCEACGAVLANLIWTVFNTTVMAVFGFIAHKVLK
jgi:hypothetical protein